MRIDAHQHFWKIDRGDYGWLTPAKGPIYRDFGPADLALHLAKHGIDRSLLVQAAATEAETRYMLDIARTTPSVSGVVGWADMAAPDGAARVAALASDPLLVGLRPMLQDIADDDWLLQPALAPAVAAMKAAGLVYDALARPRHLSRVLVFADRHPDIPIVVDHGAKPFIRERRLDPWRADIAALAARPNVTCKFSGLANEAAQDWTAGDLAPYVAHIFKVFGPGRVMWGSDWPVVILGGGYDRWRAAAEELTAGLTPAERDAVFGGNAARVYLGKRGRK
jgi:L-fuconolactonase